MNQEFQKIPQSGFMRLPEVLQLIPISKSSWWDGVKKGTYPEPIHIGQRVTAWRVEDIEALIEKLSRKN